MAENNFSSGWIKVYRQTAYSSIWDTDEEYDKRSAWIDLLLSVNYEHKEVVIGNQSLIVGRGQKFTSIRKLAKRWKWSNERTLAYLRLLEDLKMITRERTHNGTLLTIVNYGFYQNQANTSDNTIEDTSDNTIENTSDNTTPPQIKNNKNIRSEDCISVVQSVKHKKKAESSSDNIDVLFEELWKLYPKKRGKGQISTTQKKKLLIIGREEMIRAIDRYKKDTAGKDSQYIKNGSTFFNTGYIDYLDSNYEEPATNMDGFNWDSLD